MDAGRLPSCTWPAALPMALMVPPIDSPASSRRLAGSTFTAPSSRPRYIAESTEPRIATPSAPPTIRTVLVTAEPAPAFSRGTIDMATVVAGAITMPPPMPQASSSSSMAHTGVVCSIRVKNRNTTPVSSIPPAITARAPNRSTSRALRGAIAMMPSDTGTTSRPARSGANPRTTCQ